MEKLRILLVEDNEIQASWARKSLSDHDVKIVTNSSDARKEIEENQWDLILTDLFLPDCEGGEPWFKEGLEIFEEGLRLLTAGKIRGLALISDHEHHVNELPIDSKRKERIHYLLQGLKQFTETIGKNFETMDSTGHIGPITSELVIQRDRSLNVLFIFDLNLHNYTHFMSPRGEICTSEEIKGRFADAPQEPVFYCVREHGYINLKPFHVIVKVLG